MAKTVKVEGRLISVPDDATPDEIDQIASGGQAPVKPPSFIDKTVSNIPSSLGRVITHPYGEGMPMPVKENYARGEYPPQFQDVLPGIKRFVQHPIDTTIGAVKGAVSEAPVETALGVAALGRQAMPETAGKIGAVTSGAAKGAFKDATEMVPFRRFGHEVSVPRPLLGAAAGELAGWMSHIPHAPVAGAIIGGVAPIIKGAYEGGKAALSDFRAAPVEPRIPAWMTESDINIKPNLSDVPVGPVGKPALPSGRVPGKMPVAAPETPQVQPEAAPGTQGPGKAANEPSAFPVSSLNIPSSGLIPKGGEISPGGRPTEVATEVIKPGTGAPGDVNGPKMEVLNPLKLNDPQNVNIDTGLMWKVINRDPELKTSIAKHTYEKLQKMMPDEVAKWDKKNNPQIIDVTPAKQIEGQTELKPSEIGFKPHEEVTSQTTDPNKQYSWDDIKEKYGSERVRTTKAKLQDLSERLKKAEIPIEKFLSLPQEAQDAFVKIPKHATQVNRSKYSTGFHRGYSDLLKEIHGSE